MPQQIVWPKSGAQRRSPFQPSDTSSLTVTLYCPTDVTSGDPGSHEARAETLIRELAHISGVDVVDSKPSQLPDAVVLGLESLRAKATVGRLHFTSCVFLCNTLQEVLDSTVQTVGERRRDFDVGTTGGAAGSFDHFAHAPAD